MVGAVLFAAYLPSLCYPGTKMCLMAALSSVQPTIVQFDTQPKVLNKLQNGVFVHLEQDDRALLLEATVDDHQKNALYLRYWGHLYGNF